MKLQKNHFRDALRDGKTQIGLWIALPDANVAEAVATAGFDWLLFDAEHAPNDPRLFFEQLRAAPHTQSTALCVPVQADPALVKQYLDIGAQTVADPDDRHARAGGTYGPARCAILQKESAAWALPLPAPRVGTRSRTT